MLSASGVSICVRRAARRDENRRLTIALMAGAANAQTSHKRGLHNTHGHFTERSVRLGSEPAVPPPNADLKYGAQPAYPQSPPGGGY